MSSNETKITSLKQANETEVHELKAQSESMDLHLLKKIEALEKKAKDNNKKMNDFKG